MPLNKKGKKIMKSMKKQYGKKRRVKRYSMHLRTKVL